MNKLKRLFSPNSLAAMIGTGLLLGTTTIALAETCYSTSVVFDSGDLNCNFPGEISCFGYDNWYRPVYFCCPEYQSCGSVQGPDAPFYVTYGWCCSDP